MPTPNAKSQTISEKPPRFVLAAKIDRDELAVRILETLTDTSRPKGFSGTQALAATDEDIAEHAREAALVAVFYMKECLEDAPVSSAQ